ncbi:MAG: peptidoglycan recognition protein family protein [Acidimicrobiales bacterium]
MENRANWLVVGGLAVFIVALVVAALDIAGDGETSTGATTTGEATTTSASTTTTTQPTTTTTPLSPEDEIRRAAAELFELRDEVLQNPDPNRILEYAEDQSPLYAMDRDGIGRLVAANARWASDPSQVLGVRLELLDPRSPSLTIVIDFFEADVVSADGQVLEHVPAGRVAYGISLLGSAGNWKINDFFVGDQILPSVMDEVISLGVP